jgi:hypothetical protein
MFIYLYAFFVLWFLNSIKDITIKHSLKWINSGVLAWITSLFTIFLTIPFLINEWIPKSFPPNFIWAFLFWGVFYYSWKYFNFIALSLWDISLISPMKWLITLSTVITSFLLLWEWISFIWWIWLILVILWTYTLAIEKTHTHILSPIKALWSDKWSRMYLFCILFYWFTVTIDRIWVLWSSIWFWTLSMNLFVFIFSLPDIIKHRKTIIKSFKGIYISFCIIILLHYFIYISKMYVVWQILAPYTSAFNTSSALFSVVLWWRFFKEKGLMKRFLSWLIILIWVILISFFW